MGSVEMGASLHNFTTLGARVTEFVGFDTFKCPDGVRLVTFTSSELTAVCPVTGQPDLYTIEIGYEPVALCVESKTLKLYLHQFRNEGVFGEALAARIASDIQEATRCAVCRVRLHQSVRGGLQMSVYAEKEIERDPA